MMADVGFIVVHSNLFINIFILQYIYPLGLENVKVLSKCNKIHTLATQLYKARKVL